MKVTAIILARDEEAVITRAIASIRAGVDEVLVYDTGSVDATRKLATEAGAKVVTDGPWEKWHFADARNRAAELAAHDWLFTIDADEVVREGVDSIRGAAAIAAIGKVHCVGVRWRMRETGGLFNDITPRLYDRRVWGYRYKVHNVLLPLNVKRAPNKVSRAIEIEHIPDAAKRPGRLNQTVALLEEAVLEEPEHVEVHRYLADIYLNAGAYDKAAVAARRYTRAARGKVAPAYLSEGWALLARALDGQGERGEALAAFETAASVAPTRREPLWEAAQLVGRAGRWGDAAAYVRQLLKIPRQAMQKYSPFTSEAIWGRLAEEALVQFEQAAVTTAGKGS